MPAAAVIPALKMHRIIAAVKKLVVGSVPGTGSTSEWHSAPRLSAGLLAAAFAGRGGRLALLL